MRNPQCFRKFIITTWEGGGSVGPALTVARKLVDAGHDVRVMGEQCNHRESEATGARFVPWTRAPNRHDRTRDSEFVRDWDGETIAAGMTQVMLALTAGRAKDYAEDVIEELDREGADLVIGSDLLLGVELGCEAADQPCVVLACNSIMFPVDGAPPAGPPITAEQSAMLQPVLDQLSLAFANVLPVYNAARANFGLPPLTNMWNQLVTAKKTFIAVSRTFDFGPEMDEGQFHYIGPQIDEVDWAHSWRSVDEPGDARPLILISFSTTFQNHKAALQNVVAAFADLPVRAVLTLGPTISPDEIDAPPNVCLVHSAPHNEIMRQASLVVTHGGHGTIARALMHGLPMLVMPHGRDQGGNAARVAAHSAGIVLPPDANVDAIRAAMSKLLNDPSYCDGALGLGKTIREEMRAIDVVAELELLCDEVLAPA